MRETLGKVVSRMRSPFKMKVEKYKLVRGDSPSGEKGMGGDNQVSEGRGD